MNRNSPERPDGRRANGGQRRGAGRKPGRVTIKTRAIAEQLVDEGISPLEVQIRTMRALWKEAERDGEIIDFEKAVAACAVAKDAAPYLHPRLSNIEATVDVNLHESALDELE